MMPCFRMIALLVLGTTVFAAEPTNPEIERLRNLIQDPSASELQKQFAALELRHALTVQTLEQRLTGEVNALKQKVAALENQVPHLLTKNGIGFAGTYRVIFAGNGGDARTEIKADDSGVHPNYTQHTITLDIPKNRRIIAAGAHPHHNVSAFGNLCYFHVTPGGAPAAIVVSASAHPGVNDRVGVYFWVIHVPE